ncbi:MAG: protease PrsW [Deltaproteobacteria bacterium]|jgi:RsiW-degrading membrane proteinase PrsW (M82 family)|nr:protease PrsW [Deltaproteobacteria bacterium]MBW2536976.1 protease PrsW [Deltaproteobacteria bacterium]
MSVSHWAAAGAILLATIGAHLLILRRSPYLRLHMLLWLGAMGAGAAMVVPVLIARHLLEQWAAIDPVSGTGGQVTLLLYAFLVVAPLEQGMVVAAVAGFWRMRRLRIRAGLSRQLETAEGVAFAASASLGFACVRDVVYLLDYGVGWLDVARAAMALACFVLLSSFWGYALGRHAHRGLSGRQFSGAWLAATIFTAVSNQMVFRGGVGSLLALLPLVLTMLVVGWVLWRNAQPTGHSSSGGRFSILTSAPAPSLDTIREAFRRHDRPITLRWISFGALVTTGMIAAGVVGAVVVGHKVGLDFSAVDRHDAGADAMAPVALLGIGVLAAFPAAGYLLARASGTRSVLEPAMGASLAMLLVLVFMGMLAPASVVFAIAFAPIAFALSCAGAWLGLGS